MGIKDKILTYLLVHGKENKYKIARALKIDVSELTRALGDLEKKEKIEMKTGRAMLVKGKKPIITKPRKREKKRKKRPRVKVKKEIKKAEAEKKEYEKEAEKEEEKEETEETPPEEEPEEEKPKTEVSEEVSEEAAEEERVEGTVKFFNLNKGFGFITGDDGKEYYVHESGLKESVTIEADDRVSFKAVQSEKGPRAEEVEKIS